MDTSHWPEDLTPSLRRLCRAFIALWVVGATYACIAQLFLQEAAARYSSWGYTPGWQREIGFWNIGLIAILVPILLHGTRQLLLSAIRALVLLSSLFGTNHAVEVFRGGQLHLGLYSHVGGALENYVAVLLGVVVLIACQRAT